MLDVSLVTISTTLTKVEAELLTKQAKAQGKSRAALIRRTLRLELLGWPRFREKDAHEL